MFDVGLPVQNWHFHYYCTDHHFHKKQALVTVVQLEFQVKLDLTQVVDKKVGSGVHSLKVSSYLGLERLECAPCSQ